MADTQLTLDDLDESAALGPRPETGAAEPRPADFGSTAANLVPGRQLLDDEPLPY